MEMQPRRGDKSKSLRSAESVQAYYDPADPSLAVLRSGLEGQDVFSLFIVAPFGVIAAGMWLIWARLDLVDQLTTWDDGFQTRVRLSVLGPKVVGLGIGVILDIVMLVALGYGFDADPPMSAVLAGWGLVFAGGLLAYWLCWRSISRGTMDLVIDDSSHTVTIPPTLDREEPIVVPMRRIKSVEVESQLRETGDKTLYHYFPTLVFEGVDGSTHRERLIKFSDTKDAEKLLAWLHKRLGTKLSGPNHGPGA